MKAFLMLVPALLISCASLTSNSVSITEKKELGNFRALEAELNTHAEKFDPSNILVVFDIDNTLLQNNIALGSEQWFYWQEGLLKSESKQKVANGFSGLLKVQGLLFDLDPMKLTDQDLDEVVAGLQSKGMKTIVLTSRGPEFRSATERTLNAHGLDFSKHKIGEDVGGTYLPYEVEKLSKLDQEMISRKAAAPISYVNGLAMTAGQHKGLMLKQLLKKFSFNPELVVFIDNHDKQVTRVYDAFRGEENVISYRYTGMDKTYEAFNAKKNQDRAASDWLRLKSYLDNLYGTKF